MLNLQLIIQSDITPLGLGEVIILLNDDKPEGEHIQILVFIFLKAFSRHDQLSSKQFNKTN